MGSACLKTIIHTSTRLFVWHKRLRYLLVAGAIGLSLIGGTNPAFADNSFAYVVQPGDTAVAIAQHYGIPLTGLVSTNPGVDLDLLPIGETIRVDPINGPAANLIAPVYVPGFNVPSFDITPDGISQRSLTWVPSIPPILEAPYHSQFDGTIWASGNCGPTALSMALGTLGITADQTTLRSFANHQMGSSNPNNGTSWESLAYAARQSGAVTESLTVGKTYHKWTLDELRSEFKQKRPVMLLVRYWDLPDHTRSTFAGDHYILALGFDSAGNLVYADPAEVGGSSNLTIGPAQLLKAWTGTADGQVRTAMAIYR